jgi:hypothetical protein
MYWATFSGQLSRNWGKWIPRQLYPSTLPTNKIYRAKRLHGRMIPADAVRCTNTRHAWAFTASTQWPSCMYNPRHDQMHFHDNVSLSECRHGSQQNIYGNATGRTSVVPSVCMIFGLASEHASRILARTQLTPIPELRYPTDTCLLWHDKFRRILPFALFD